MSLVCSTSGKQKWLRRISSTQTNQTEDQIIYGAHSARVVYLVCPLNKSRHLQENPTLEEGVNRHGEWQRVSKLLTCQRCCYRLDRKQTISTAGRITGTQYNWCNFHIRGKFAQGRNLWRYTGHRHEKGRAVRTITSLSNNISGDCLLFACTYSSEFLSMVLKVFGCLLFFVSEYGERASKGIDHMALK